MSEVSKEQGAAGEELRAGGREHRAKGEKLNTQ